MNNPHAIWVEDVFKHLLAKHEMVIKLDVCGIASSYSIVIGSRGGSRAAATSKTERFVIIVNG